MIFFGIDWVVVVMVLFEGYVDLIVDIFFIIVFMVGVCILVFVCDVVVFQVVLMVVGWLGDGLGWIKDGIVLEIVFFVFEEFFFGLCCIVEMIQGMLIEVGVKVNIEMVDNVMMYECCLNFDYDLIFFVIYGVFYDLYGLLGVFFVIVFDIGLDGKIYIYLDFDVLVVIVFEIGGDGCEGVM